jgi:hypothetical protein
MTRYLNPSENRKAKVLSSLWELNLVMRKRIDDPPKWVPQTKIEAFYF